MVAEHRSAPSAVNYLLAFCFSNEKRGNCYLTCFLAVCHRIHFILLTIQFVISKIVNDKIIFVRGKVAKAEHSMPM